MSRKYGFFTILGLFFLIGAVTGVGIPDTVTVTTNTPWIIANNVDQSTITLIVTNTTPGYDGAIEGVTLNLTLDSFFGTMSPTIVTTNSNGTASSTFKVKTKSGKAQIIAEIPSIALSNSTIQNIDHDTPYNVNFTHPLSGTVATSVPFNISITDHWGNRIDNLRGDHTVSLHMHGPAPDDCGFIIAETLHHDISTTLDANGNSSLIVRLTTKVGPNYFLMDTLGSIPDKLEWINADSTGIPVSIAQAFSPSGSPPAVPANGISKFNITYSLFDTYGNPVRQQLLWVNTSINGEEAQFTSNSLGQIKINYGPRSSAGTVHITATSVANNSVTISQDVEFIPAAAPNVNLTANPETMASRDSNPAITADIVATVTDEMGNPAEGEIVTFSLGTVGYPGGPYNVTSLPSLTSSTATTNADGQAIVQFIPGSFSTTESTTATGNISITATWDSISKNQVITWKNYPYLGMKTSVQPQTVQVNETVDISIDIVGDGWALQQTPAEINATMRADFQNVNVTGISVPGNQVFSYIFHPSNSTRIGWQDGVMNVTNQSADWTADNRLDFTIGTIRVGQNWNATFRLKANKCGSIDVFGPDSLISVNGGTSTQSFPPTFVTVVPTIIPVVNFTTQIGVFRQSARQFIFNTTPITRTTFGLGTDMPITGDWNGDGSMDVGVFRPSTCQFILNTAPVTRITFGLSTDIPITGDWNNDGKTDIGVFRQSAQQFIFNTSPITRTTFGLSTDIPITGDWNGDGITDIGVFRPSARQLILNTAPITRVTFGLSTDIPITGDWNNDGKTDIGVFRQTARQFIFNTSPITRTTFGMSTDIPITGKWV